VKFVVSSHLLTIITALIHHSFDSSGNQPEHPEARSQRVHGWDGTSDKWSVLAEISDYAAVRSWASMEGAGENPVFRPDGARPRPTSS
jgi:hypothetical protein